MKLNYQKSENFCKLYNAAQTMADRAEKGIQVRYCEKETRVINMITIVKPFDMAVLEPLAAFRVVREKDPATGNPLLQAAIKFAIPFFTKKK